MHSYVPIRKSLSSNRSRQSRGKRSLWISLVLLLAVGILIFGAYMSYNRWNVTDNKDYTISIVRDYELAKNESQSGTYLGAYVLQNSTIDFSMKKFNELAQRDHITFFKYVGYGRPFPTDWVNNVKSINGFPSIAFEPNNGLDEVEDGEYLREFARAAKEANVPILLRYASEMNGTWTNYSQDPDKYIEKWKLVHQVMEEEAPNVAMLWAVLSVPEGEIDKFYPGDEYVDWVGVNIYNVKYHNNHKYEPSAFEDPLDLLNYVYTKYSYNKPIQISEFGVTHYNTTDDVIDHQYAIDKITRLYTELPKSYPRVKAVYYFDVNNMTEYNSTRRINDYSITTEPDLIDAYAQAIKDPQYLSEYTPSREGETIQEQFTYRGQLFSHNDVIYADIDFFTNYVQALVAIDGKNITVTKDNRSVTVKSVNRRVWAGYKTKIVLNKFRDVKGLPVQQVLEELGYIVNIEEDGKKITVQKTLE